LKHGWIASFFGRFRHDKGDVRQQHILLVVVEGLWRVKTELVPPDAYGKYSSPLLVLPDDEERNAW
jgi:hypothetical protein